MALEKPTSGEILIDGEEIVPLSERELNRVRKKFGMVYQYAALLDSITVLENVAFPLVEHTKLSAEGARREGAREARRTSGSTRRGRARSFRASSPGGCESGSGIARALMLEPPILVYDEPTSGLDPLTSRMVDDLIEEMRERFRVTSIVISHDIASCFRIAHQAVLLIDGKVVAHGTPDELAHGANEVAREFIQKSEVDIERCSRVALSGT